MGRPLQKKLFGPLDGDDTTPVGERWTRDGRDQKDYDTSSNARLDRTGINLPVEQARVTGGDLDVGGEGSLTPYVLFQKGARRFKVRTADGDGVCKLVDSDGSSQVSEGEMILRGFVDDAGDGVLIRKISGRKAYDFNGGVYKWRVVGDGSTLANRIVLEQI